MTAAYAMGDGDSLTLKGLVDFFDRVRHHTPHDTLLAQIVTRPWEGDTVVTHVSTYAPAPLHPAEPVRATALAVVVRRNASPWAVCQPEDFFRVFQRQFAALDAVPRNTRVDLIHPVFAVDLTGDERGTYECACGHRFEATPAPETNVVFCTEKKGLVPVCPRCKRTNAAWPETSGSRRYQLYA